MALLHDKNDKFKSYDINNYESSQKRISEAMRRLKEKKKFLEDIQNEYKLLELDSFRVYKEEISYIMLLLPSKIEEARKWLSMINNKNIKIDKRKKYREKESFEYVERELQKIFNKPDIKIIDLFIFGFYRMADIIIFTCNNHKFNLTIPIIENISFKEYQDYGICGEELFKLSLSNNDNETISKQIGSTFDENELKDILNRWFMENYPEKENK